MSAETALMGGTALIGAASSVMGGYSRAEGYGANARALEFQADVQGLQAAGIEFGAEIARNRGSLIRKGLVRYDVEASGIELQGEEVLLQAAQEERTRRAAIKELLGFNAADLGSRGVEGGIGSSADVMERHNVAEGERDVKNIRTMGESRKRYLSFAADDTRIAKGYAAMEADAQELEAGNIMIQGSMARLGAVATRQQAQQQWAQVSPSIGMGWLQGAMTLGQAGYRMMGK